jgi:hypothetical protein
MHRRGVSTVSGSGLRDVRLGHAQPCPCWTWIAPCFLDLDTPECPQCPRALTRGLPVPFLSCGCVLKDGLSPLAHLPGLVRGAIASSGGLGRVGPVIDVSGAVDLAAARLAGSLPRRWRHVRSVARRARWVAKTLALPDDLVAAAGCMTSATLRRW